MISIVACDDQLPWDSGRNKDKKKHLLCGTSPVILNSSVVLPHIGDLCVTKKKQQRQLAFTIGSFVFEEVPADFHM